MTDLSEQATAALPDSATMLGWIEEIVAQGIRRPGDPADVWTEQFVADAFVRFGLQDVHFEPVTLPRWSPDKCTLQVWPADDQTASVTFDGFQLPHSAGITGLEANLAPLDGSAGPVAGKLAVGHLELSAIPQTLMASLATAVYDPDDEFATYVQTVPFSPLGQEVLEPAIEAGAVGFVGLLSGMPWETCDYYVPYDGIARPIPGIWLSRSDADALDAMMSQGPLRGVLTAEAERVDVESHNVIGVLPGASDEWVVIATHHDGPWASAVEDASGVALVLAQAAYWSQIPENQRPHNLMFVVTAGHMVAGEGTQQFIRAHRDLMPQIVLEIHLEHAACEAMPTADGQLVAIDAPEPRWWFTTRNPDLEAAVLDALVRNDLRRSLIFKPDAIAPIPTTDGGFFFDEGVPLVNFISAPMYLFDSADTLDKIHEPSLVPLSQAAAQLVEWTHARTAADVRAGVLEG